MKNRLNSKCRGFLKKFFKNLKKLKNLKNKNVVGLRIIQQYMRVLSKINIETQALNFSVVKCYRYLLRAAKNRSICDHICFGPKKNHSI